MDGPIKRAHNISSPAAISDVNIRHLARVALADFAVIPSHLIHLASHHNDVFRVDTEKGSRFLLRIRRCDAHQAVSQLHWLKFLSSTPRMFVCRFQSPHRICFRLRIYK